jgi:peptidoglycan hydrolase-like protein with peptidoglycan-binding domain
VFDSSVVDTQLGTGVILKALMQLDSSIDLGGTVTNGPSQHPASQEPDDELTQSTLWLQGSLNKLGANSPLAEDGKNGPKTMAAVSQFQRENGLPDTGLADAATIAAIGQKLSSTPANGQAPGDLIVAIKQLLDQLQKGGGIPIPAPGNDPTTMLQQVANILQKLNIGPKTTTSTSIQTQDQAAQLQKILDFVGGLVNPGGKSLPLGQVNGALGETIGNLLNGNKTAIGLIGTLLTGWLSNVPTLPPGATANGLTGFLQLIAGSIPGFSGFTMPLFVVLTAWGVLGKLEKWAQGTAPPPK